jgi:hypothetical protein
VSLKFLFFTREIDMYRTFACILATPLALTLSVVDAHATDCNSLFAVAIKQDGGLTDCTTDTLAAPAGQDCQIGETADGCASRAYDAAELLSLPTAGRPMQAKWLPKCADGTNTCGANELRCDDGTRPMVHFGKAVDQNGDSMFSSGWVIHMGGEGGLCNGNACWDMYMGTGGNGAAHQQAMSAYHLDFVNFKGAHFPPEVILMGSRWYLAYPMSRDPLFYWEGLSCDIH